MTPSGTEIAWAAGLFEGEGCFGVYHRKKGTKQVLVKLGSTDRDVVERFHAIVGCGAVHQPRVDSRPNRKAVHTWVVYEAIKVCEVIDLFMPWLGIRRAEKAAEVLKVAKSMSVAADKRTHCPHGHPYAGSNLGLSHESRSKTPTRYCRACRQIYKRSLRVAA